jgi:hypothetical protein
MRPPCRRRAPHSGLTATDKLASKRAFSASKLDMSPPRRPSCGRETAALHDVAMKQAYPAAVPAIGFVQVWFSPDQVPFAEQTSSVAPFHRAAKAAHAPSEKEAD